MLLDESGKPVVAHVDAISEPGAWYVYLSVREAFYHWVVVVRPNATGELAISGMYWAAEVRVYLVITSAGLSPDEITARVGLAPTETHEMGASGPISKIACREHYWRLEPERGTPGSIENKLTGLLSRVESAAESIAALRPECEIWISIVYYGWAGDPQFAGFGFEAEIVRRIAGLGAELDFGMYGLGPKMLEHGESQ